jgi:hypothetical protein
LGSWIIGLGDRMLKHAAFQALERNSIISVGTMERKEGEFLKN